MSHKYCSFVEGMHRSLMGAMAIMWHHCMLNPLRLHGAIGSGNVLLPDSIKPLPEPVLTNNQGVLLEFTTVLLHKGSAHYPGYNLENYWLNITARCPRNQWANVSTVNWIFSCFPCDRFVETRLTSDSWLKGEFGIWNKNIIVLGSSQLYTHTYIHIWQITGQHNVIWHAAYSQMVKHVVYHQNRTARNYNAFWYNMIYCNDRGKLWIWGGAHQRQQRHSIFRHNGRPMWCIL